MARLQGQLCACVRLQEIAEIPQFRCSAQKMRGRIAEDSVMRKIKNRATRSLLTTGNRPSDGRKECAATRSQSTPGQGVFFARRSRKSAKALDSGASSRRMARA